MKKEENNLGNWITLIVGLITIFVVTPLLDWISFGVNVSVNAMSGMFVLAGLVLIIVSIVGFITNRKTKKPMSKKSKIIITIVIIVIVIAFYFLVMNQPPQPNYDELFAPIEFTNLTIPSKS